MAYNLAYHDPMLPSSRIVQTALPSCLGVPLRRSNLALCPVLDAVPSLAFQSLGVSTPRYSRIVMPTFCLNRSASEGIEPLASSAATRSTRCIG